MTSLATTCIDRQIQALQGLHEVLKNPMYARIREEVIRCAQSNGTSRVLVAGVGKNSSIASKISDTMVSLGIPSHALNVSHLGHGDYGRVQLSDFVIHISRSGTTREMLEAIDHLRLIRPTAKQALIHCKLNKEPNTRVFYELFAGEVQEGDEHGLAPTTSTTVLLCLLDCISVEASHALGFRRLDFLTNHPDGALGRMLKEERQ